MIIGFLETGEIRIYSSIADALIEWGPFPSDVASDVAMFYDQDGTRLKPVERFAPRKWFQLQPTVLSLELERESPHETSSDPIGYLLNCEATHLAPNTIVDSLEELREMFPWKR